MRKSILILLAALTLGLTSCSSDNDGIVEEPQINKLVMVYAWVIEYEVYRDFTMHKVKATQVMYVDEVTHEVLGAKLYSGFIDTKPVRNDVELKAIGEFIDIAEYEDVYIGLDRWYGND